MSFPVLFDTNVLFGALLNDYILWLADRGLFRPLWSSDILTELEQNLLEHGVADELVHKRITTMTTHFPDAMVSGHEPLIPTLTCDPKDRHVLAAAIRANAEVLVTFNTTDFPGHSTEQYDIEVVHPDEFLLDQLDLYPGATVATFNLLVDTYNSPRMTADDVLRALARSAPSFSAALNLHLG